MNPVVQTALSRLTKDEIEALKIYFSQQHQTQKTKRSFSPAEDQLLRQLVANLGSNNWKQIAANMEGRNSKQCKERWTHYLNPNISHDPWTPQEDELLCQKVDNIGTKWTEIAKFFPRRTDTSVKNRWVVLMRKRALHEEHPLPPKLSQPTVIIHTPTPNLTSIEPNGSSFNYNQNLLLINQNQQGQNQVIRFPPVINFNDMPKTM